MKRYAIVRVDNNCPFYTELVTTKCWIYKNEKSCIGFKCKIKKTYGDTKQQLIKKVATAILRNLKDGEVLKYEEFGTGFIKQPVSVEYLAKEIVEFLGVEDDKKRRR